MQDTSKPTQPRWGAQRVMAWVALLYFSEGLPLGLFYDLFPVNLRQAGVSGISSARDRVNPLAKS